MSALHERALAALGRFESVHLNPTADSEDVERAELELGHELPSSYRWFLTEIANGGSIDDIELFPVAVSGAKNLKRTWNSLQRNNRPESTPYLHGDLPSLQRFLVFASRGAACFALPYEGEQRVWLWQPSLNEMLELDYDFLAWLAATYELGNKVI